MNEPFVQWPIAGAWTSISIPMSTYIWVNLWFSCDPPFASWHSQNMGCIVILPSHHYADYTEILVTDFILLSRYYVPASLWCSHLCLTIRWWMPSQREGPKNISSLSEEEIPHLSYPTTCQTFRCVCKLSLWSPCYRWHLSNPKVHHTVRSEHDTLMV